MSVVMVASLSLLIRMLVDRLFLLIDGLLKKDNVNSNLMKWISNEYIFSILRYTCLILEYLIIRIKTFLNW